MLYYNDIDFKDLGSYVWVEMISSICMVVI